MRKLRLLTLSSLAIIFIASSCTKEGPEGPAGASGAQGPAGTPGTPGTPGAGITVYSDWYTTTAADWLTTGVDQYTAAALVNRTAPAITQTIIDRGVVLGYVSGWRVFGFPRATETAQMPYLADLNFLDYYDFVVPSAGNIRYLYKSFDPWPPADLAGTKFRYIAIAGSLAGRNATPTYAGYTKEQLKAMSYDEVISLFKIPAEGSNIE